MNQPHHANPRHPQPDQRQDDPERDTPQDQPSGDEGERPMGTSRLEWAFAALGALLLLGVIATLVYEGVVGDVSPPHITFTVHPAQARGEGYLVPVTAHNHGDRTAASVDVEATLVWGDGERQVSRARLDYLPESSDRELGVFFSHDPSRGTVTVRATAYVEP